MILSDVREYLQQRGQATLGEMALHFDIEPDALRGMLDLWVRKGRVHKRLATAACGSSCGQCRPEATEIYTWAESRVDSSGLLSGTCSR